MELLSACLVKLLETLFREAPNLWFGKGGVRELFLKLRLGQNSVWVQTIKQIDPISKNGNFHTYSILSKHEFPSDFNPIIIGIFWFCQLLCTFNLLKTLKSIENDLSYKPYFPPSIFNWIENSKFTFKLSSLYYSSHLKFSSIFHVFYVILSPFILKFWFANSVLIFKEFKCSINCSRNEKFYEIGC